MFYVRVFVFLFKFPYFERHLHFKTVTVCLYKRKSCIVTGRLYIFIPKVNV